MDMRKGQEWYMGAKLTFIIAAFLIAFLLSGCKQKSNDDEVLATPTVAENKDLSDKKSVVLTVGSLEATYEEILIYMQSQKQEIETLYGSDIWSYQLDDQGITYGDKLKDQVLEEIVYIKTICAQADSLEIALSEDEVMDVLGYTADFLSNFTSDDLKYYGITEDTVRKIYEENVLANKIYERLTLNVNTDVSDEEVRHVILWYLLIAKYTYDEDGNRVDYTEEELIEQKKRAEEIYERAAEEDFYILARENSSDEDEIEIVVGRGEMKPEFEEAVFVLKENEITEILEDETGYFIFYCKSEMDKGAAAEAKEKIIVERQNSAFYINYNAWLAETEIIIQEELWDKINFSDDIF